MHALTLFAGLAWDPGIRGILIVVVGVAVLCGSVWLLVASNTGARLGLLISLAGLFGWLMIHTAFWWIQPPAIGPSGKMPSWKVKEIYIHNSNYTDRVNDGPRLPAQHPVLDGLPEPVDLPTGTEVIEQHPEFEPKLVTRPENTNLSDLVPLSVDGPDGGTITGADVLASDFNIRSADVYLNVPTEGATKLGEWKLNSTQAAGDRQAVADAVLVEEGLFADTTEFRKLNSYETGGNPKRKEECKDDDLVCRAIFRIQKTFRVTHPPRYAVVQVQRLVPEAARPGQPPPVLALDTEQPVISVLMERDLGNYRAKPAYWFVISSALFVIFVLVLHNREKILAGNLEAARAAKK